MHGFRLNFENPDNGYWGQPRFPYICAIMMKSRVSSEIIMAAACMSASVSSEWLSGGRILGLSYEICPWPSASWWLVMILWMCWIWTVNVFIPLVLVSSAHMDLQQIQMWWEETVQVCVLLFRWLRGSKWLLHQLQLCVQRSGFPMLGFPGAWRLPGSYGGSCTGTVFYTSSRVSFHYRISCIDGPVIFAEKDL